jgi:hypothetical protein
VYLSNFFLFDSQYSLIRLNIFQRLVNKILLFLLRYFFLIILFDWVCNICYFFLLNCLFSLFDLLLMIKRIHFFLDRKTRKDVWLLRHYDRRFGKNWIFDIFDGFSLFVTIFLSDFRGLNLEYLYAKAKFFSRECHLLNRFLFLIVCSHLLIF